MISVAGHSKTDYFSIYMGISFFSMLQALQHYYATTFGNDKSVALFIKRPAGFLGLIISGRKRPKGAEPAYPRRNHATFRAAGNHDIRIPALDNPESISNGMAARSTGSSYARVRALKTKGYSHMAGSFINDKHRDKKWAKPF